MDKIASVSPQVIVGIVFLLLAMVVGYLVVFADAKDKAGSETAINADDYFKSTTDASPEDMDEKFAEYLQEEKRQKIEESPDIMGGQTERYTWQQTAKEVDIYVPLDTSCKSKDIICKITGTKVHVSINGDVVLDGDFVSNVVPSECNWQIDGEGDNRKIWISLFKATPSVKGRFWRRVLQGDDDLNPELNKAPVYGIDPNDPNSIKSAIDSVRGVR